MSANENPNYVQSDTTTVDTPEHEIMRLTAEGNPDAMVKLLERKALLASRWQAAIHKMLVSFTFQTDWTQFPGTKDNMMCLGSAGAERMGTHFPIEVCDVKWHKEEWTDAIGPAYRYIYEGYGKLGDRKAYAQGVYSSREELLGKAQGEYKAIEEVKETSIRNAAYHIFNGNLIKALLGLRAFPQTEWNKIFKDIGQQPGKASKASFKTGAKGGKGTAATTDAQTELYNILTELAGQNCVIILDDETQELNCQYREGERDALAAESGRNCAAFKNRDNKWIYPNYHFTKLQDKWLHATLDKAKQVKERFDKGEFADFGDTNEST